MNKLKELLKAVCKHLYCRLNRRTDLYWICTLVLLIPITYSVSSAWFEWYAIEEHWAWAKAVYRFLDGRYAVNIPISIALFLFTLRWVLRFWKDHDIRLYRPLLVILGLIILSSSAPIYFAKIVYGIDYRDLGRFLLVFLLIAMIGKVFWRDCPIANRQSLYQNTNEESPSLEYLKVYAKAISDQALRGRTEKESYAIGVTGEWGSGKTTFLELIRKEFAGKAEIVRFNPWMCQSPEQVTQDLFASMRQSLSPKYSRLSRPIQEYAKHLNSVTLTPIPFLNIEMRLSTNEDSLDLMKSNLSREFARLPHPVVVLVDDIDRLEREEVFEVLRLIRNTADLSNTIYIVAYDKEYVTSVLEEKRIKDAASYLEKIFNLEAHLPKATDSLIWEKLWREIEAQDKEVGKLFARKLSERFNGYDQRLILRVLNTYRRVERFAQLYMLNACYMHKHYNNGKNPWDNEILFQELFWLELLQIYDKPCYDKLASEQGYLLDLQDECLRLKLGINKSIQENIKNAPNIYTGDRFWKEETPDILFRIFPPYRLVDSKSIRYPENYDKYFTLSISQYRLSIKKLNTLFADGSNQEEIIQKWVDDGIYLDSIAFQLNQISAYGLQGEKLKNFLRGILYLGFKTCNHLTIIKSIKRLLWDKSYKNNTLTTQEIIVSWFKEIIEQKNDISSLVRLSELLNRLYRPLLWHDKHLGTSEPISLAFTTDMIIDILKNIIRDYLERHPESTAIDLLREKEELGLLFANCCVITSLEDENDDEPSYNQVAFNTVIDHFKNKNDKPCIKSYEATKNIMFHNEVSIRILSMHSEGKSEYYSEADYIEELEERRRQSMRHYFGDDYAEKLNEFREKCFVPEEGESEHGAETAQEQSE